MCETDKVRGYWNWKARPKVWENPYLAMSVCELLSPSTVKGDPPVRSSYIRTPRLHQSTAWNTGEHHQQTERKRNTFPRYFSTNDLVVSRLSTLHNFWSHVFNSATHRKSPFHLFQTECWELMLLELSRWHLEQKGNWHHLIKLFTQAKVCQNYMTAWIQENILQF